MLFSQPDIAALKARRDIPALIKLLLKGGKKPWLSEAMDAIREVTGLLKEQATAPLAEALLEVKAHQWDGPINLIIGCLGQTGDPRAFDALLPLFGRYESVISAFASLGDQRAVPHLTRHLEELVRIQKNEPPVSMQDVFSGRRRTLVLITNIVVALGTLGDPSALPAIESCRKIAVETLDSDARFSVNKSLSTLQKKVDDAIRAITGTPRTAVEIEQELRHVTHEIACGRDHSFELKRRLQKLGPTSLPVFDRIVEDLAHRYSNSFAVEIALKDAKEHLGHS